MKRKFIIPLFLLLFSTSCTNTTPSDNKDDIKDETPKEKVARVFVLAGQSNMEGNTNFSKLKNFCAESDEYHDYNAISEGFSNVKISFHNIYDNNNKNFSNEEEPTKGKFVDTGLNQGVRKNGFSGPEVGIAEVLNDYGSEEEPIFLIKYTSGGTGFFDQARNGSSKWNWRSSSTSSPGDLYTGLLEFMDSNLELIETEFKLKPVIKGFLWMQGESDGTASSASNLYQSYLYKMISDFREEFKDYTTSKDGNDIAFIDATIADNGTWPYSFKINEAKENISKLGENNYLIDTNSNGLDLKVGSNEHGGGDQYHYTVDSMMRLGNAFGNIIAEEVLNV